MNLTREVNDIELYVNGKRFTGFTSKLPYQILGEVESALELAYKISIYADLTNNIYSSIVDDFCYYQGETTRVNWRIPYIIVIGGIGVGKSIYCKAMSQVDTNNQYISFQGLNRVHATFREHAQKIISLGVIK